MNSVNDLNPGVTNTSENAKELLRRRIAGLKTENDFNRVHQKALVEELEKQAAKVKKVESEIEELQTKLRKLEEATIWVPQPINPLVSHKPPTPAVLSPLASKMIEAIGEELKLERLIAEQILKCSPESFTLLDLNEKNKVLEYHTLCTWGMTSLFMDALVHFFKLRRQIYDVQTDPSGQMSMAALLKQVERCVQVSLTGQGTVKQTEDETEQTSGAIGRQEDADLPVAVEPQIEEPEPITPPRHKDSVVQHHVSPTVQENETLNQLKPDQENLVNISGDVPDQDIRTGESASAPNAASDLVHNPKPMQPLDQNPEFETPDAPIQQIVNVVEKTSSIQKQKSGVKANLLAAYKILQKAKQSKALITVPKITKMLMDVVDLSTLVQGSTNYRKNLKVSSAHFPNRALGPRQARRYTLLLDQRSEAETVGAAQKNPEQPTMKALGSSTPDIPNASSVQQDAVNKDQMSPNPTQLISKPPGHANSSTVKPEPQEQFSNGGKRTAAVKPKLPEKCRKNVFAPVPSASKVQEKSRDQDIRTGESASAPNAASDLVHNPKPMQPLDQNPEFETPDAPIQQIVNVVEETSSIQKQQSGVKANLLAAYKILQKAKLSKPFEVHNVTSMLMNVVDQFIQVEGSANYRKNLKVSSAHFPNRALGPRQARRYTSLLAERSEQETVGAVQKSPSKPEQPTMEALAFDIPDIPSASSVQQDAVNKEQKSPTLTQLISKPTGLANSSTMKPETQEQSSNGGKRAAALKPELPEKRRKDVIAPVTSASKAEKKSAVQMKKKTVKRAVEEDVDMEDRSKRAKYQKKGKGADNEDQVMNAPEGETVNKDPREFCYTRCNDRHNFKKERMIRCSNHSCDGEWFHFSCITKRVYTTKGDLWFCSTQCRADYNDDINHPVIKKVMAKERKKMRREELEDKKNEYGHHNK